MGRVGRVGRVNVPEYVFLCKSRGYFCVNNIHVITWLIPKNVLLALINLHVRCKTKQNETIQ